MEHKHFSHKHGLILYQVPQGSELTCSGCNFPGMGTIYACWECRYFLHEQCFNAARAMNHHSHPSHPLTLSLYPTYPSNSMYCNSCNLIGSGFSYSCATCEFDIHVHCAYMPNTTTHQPTTPPAGYPVNNNPSTYTSSKLDQKTTQGIMHFSHPDPLLLCTIEKDDPVICTCCETQISGGLAYSCTKLNCNFYLHKSCFNLSSEIRHKSHPKHPLMLMARSPYKNGEFGCNACSYSGKGFTYHCVVCSYDLHVDCASLPENVKRNDHEHPLKIGYQYVKQEGMIFTCDVCDKRVNDSSWMYICEKCDFGTHLECVNSVAIPKGVGEWNLRFRISQLEMEEAGRKAALDLI